MPVAIWQAGKQYLPGDIVRPTGQGDVSQTELDNANFDLGDQDWTFSGDGSETIDTNAPVFNGTYSAKLGVTDNPNGGQGFLENDARIPCSPGDVVEVSLHAQATNSASDPSRLQVRIQWYNAALAELTFARLAFDNTDLAGQALIDANGLVSYPARGIWYPLSVAGIAPAGAAYWSVVLVTTYGDDAWIVDNVQQTNVEVASPNTLLFRATQSDAGFSGGSEPDWPTVVGNTVVDNEVTWTAIAGNNITWQANRILVSGSGEPTFPTGGAGASVVDNASITWVLDPRRITDSKVPASSIALLAASKIFAADGDIIRYSATVNPLDWSTLEDAGYLPFGLQQYGANDITAMGLYRGNVAAFNSQGAQIWQVDEDPEAIAFLDAIPVSCVYPKSVQPVGDDLAFLSSVGIRSLGTTGASVNLQGGYFGKQIDPLVKASIAAAIANGWTPRGIYWPARGQYWLIFDDEAYVLTMNGTKAGDRSWSRYTFPSSIDYWTLNGDDLYLRSGDLIWKVTDDALLDDQRVVSGETLGTEFEGILQWPHLDLNRPGLDKQLKELDLILDGACQIAIGYDQRRPDYAAGQGWTTLYQIPSGAYSNDTLTAQPIPFEVEAPSFALRIVFDANQAWEFTAANLYILDTEAK